MAIASGLIYDAEGRLVATMDPVTRKRTSVAIQANGAANEAQVNEAQESLVGRRPHRSRREIWLKETRKMVAELDPKALPSGREFRAGVVLMAGWISQRPEDLAAASGEARAWCVQLARRWRTIGLWDRASKPPVFMGPLADALMTDPDPPGQEGQSNLTFWLIVAQGCGNVEYDPKTEKWRASQAALAKAVLLEMP
jgi:hypothetical protein